MVNLTTNKNTDAKFILSDTGASFHNLSNRHLFYDFRETPGRSALDAGRHSHRIIGHGTAIFKVLDNKQKPLIFKLTCECAPSLPDLINASDLHRSGQFTATLDKKGQHWTQTSTNQTYTCEYRDGQEYWNAQVLLNDLSQLPQQRQFHPTNYVPPPLSTNNVIKPRPVSNEFLTEIDIMNHNQLLHLLRSQQRTLTANQRDVIRLRLAEDMVHVPDNSDDRLLALHSLLGHRSFRQIAHFAKKHGINLGRYGNVLCSACLRVKMKRKPYSTKDLPPHVIKA